MLVIGRWIETGLTHDWVGGDFMVSQLIEAVGLAFCDHLGDRLRRRQRRSGAAAAVATTIQIARWLGSEIGSAVIQTLVRVREQVYSNLIGLHVMTGLPATAQLAGPFGSRATGIGEPAAQGTAVLASIVRREAYVLAYIDAFWLIAWVSALGILLVLLLRPPPPNPLIPSRGAG
jgi:MFS transporter, DHA2 family, multidrug resistance protein